MYRIAATETRQVPDSLQTLLDLAAFVRECEDKVLLELEFWLLIDEVFALNGLERYSEASAKVDLFFEAYFDEASDFYRARFHLWRLRLMALNGDFLGMVVSYTEAQKYADALDTTLRANLYLDGAYAYIGIREHETALRLTQEARDLIREPEAYEKRIATARSLLLGAEAQMWLNLRLDEVKQMFRASSGLYQTLGDTAHAAIATTLLGITYAAEGDTSQALAEMDTAVQLAQQAGKVRSQVYTLYRRGELLRQAGDFETARPVLSQALEASSTFQEFRLRILFELARLYEQQHDYKRAASYFQIIIDAPPSGGLVANLEAAQKAREGRIRILLIEKQRNRLLLVLSLGGMLLLLGLVGVGFYLHLRRQALYHKIKDSVVFPEDLTTGFSLDALKQRFQITEGSVLLGLRLAYLYAVLYEPERVLPYINDRYLKPQVESRSLENNTALFQCVGAVEVAREERAFRGEPANTLAAYLRSEFKKRDWEWPKNPPDWKHHFLTYHVKTLF